MKRSLLFLGVCMLVCLLCCSASAANVIMDYYVYLGPGESVMPNWPDMSSSIGKGLTKNDFVITYSPKEYVDANGRCTLPEGYPSYMGSVPVYVTYTPKVSGKGKTTTFESAIAIREPLTDLYIINNNITISLGETAEIEVRVPSNCYNDVRMSGYDKAILQAGLEYVDNEANMLTIQPLKKGSTTIDLTAYNGYKEQVKVTVTAPPSKVSFGDGEFTCFVGDTIDLGVDLGGGCYAQPQIDVTSGSSYMPADYFFPELYLNDWSRFYAYEAGEFTVKMTTYNGKTGSVRVNVRDKANCSRIELSPAVINKGEDGAVYFYDANGTVVNVPYTVTRGSALVSLSGTGVVRLQAIDVGTVTIQVNNLDGTIVKKTFEIVELPTKAYLNAERLTLNVGETYDFNVTFDQGKCDYELLLSCDPADNGQGLATAKIEGNRLIAQAPGTARVSFYARSVFVQGEPAECVVTILSGDSEAFLNGPEGKLGVGEQFQMSVKNKAGKKLKAQYQCEVLAGTTDAASITASGLLKGTDTCTVRVYATLADGRILQKDIEIVRKPTWLKHSDISHHVNHENISIVSVESDVGELGSHEFTVRVEDTSIADYSSYFRFKKPGKTKVTITAVNSNAKVTFELEVLPADGTLYVSALMLNVPAGYSAPLPKVTDFDGNLVDVVWEIVHQNAGQGNPNSTGFSLNGNKVSCSWHDASVIVRGVASDGRATEMVTVFGARQAKQIRFDQNTYTVIEGENVQVSVLAVQDADGLGGYTTGPLTWSVKDQAVISFDEDWSQTGMPTVFGLKPGKTTLTAKAAYGGASATCTIVVEKAQLQYVSGDTNTDGAVDMRDALTLLKHLAGWGVKIDMEAANVNGDSGVDMRDALTLLKYLAGWGVTLK